MAYYKQVLPGDPFRPSSKRENDISFVLNGFNGFSTRTVPAGWEPCFRIAVRNATYKTIPRGYAVATSDEDRGDAITAVRLATAQDEIYYVATENIAPNQVSCAAAMGICFAAMKENLPRDKGFIAPTPNSEGGYFTPVEYSRACVLYTMKKGGCMILLGVPGSGGEYTGCFKVTLDEKRKLHVGPGWLNRNGILFGEVQQTGEGIDPKPGILCVTSRPIDKLGNWSDPTCEILDAPNQIAYPIAEITIENDLVRIRQFPVTVATLLYSVRCPIAEL